LLFQLGVKFGANPVDALAILESAKTLGIDVVGVSFHVGSGCSNAKAFYDAVASARRVFDDGE
jgi:ornithine decarboxylase